MASSPITSWQIDGEKRKQWQILFSWALKSPWIVTVARKLKDACSLEEKLCVLKSRDITFLTKVCIVKDYSLYSQSYGFSSNHVWM